MCEILCSTGALLGKANNRDYRILEKLSEQLLCDGFEFMMYDSWYQETDQLIGSLQAMRLSIPVMHCEKHIGENISKGGTDYFEEAYRLFESNCFIAKELNASKMVVHLWDGLTSDANFRNNMDAYAKLADIAGKYEIDLLVENVVCNQEDPMKHWCELKERYPRIHFVFDTKMAAFHGQLELLYQPEYEWLWRENHICHYHVNDCAGGYKEWAKLRTLPMGKGRIDFKAFFQFIHKIGYKGTFTVEATAFDSVGMIDVDMLNGQFEYIRKSMEIPKA